MNAKALILTTLAAAAVGGTVVPTAADAVRFAPRTEVASALPAARIFDAEASALLDFWTEAGQEKWFAKDPEFDRRFRDRFLAAYEAAARGELDHWRNTDGGALALIILLDQFPRNAFRGAPRMYATDGLAREVADAAVASGFHRTAPAELRPFFVMPFGHSENVADQDRSVELAKDLGDDQHAFMAEHHRDIVRRFGRFPHRNAVLGRTTTKEEQEYLDKGGFAG